MIGQGHNLNKIAIAIAKDELEHFIVVVGDKYSGRKTLIDEMIPRLGALKVPMSNGVDDVRQMVEWCYKCRVPTVYVLDEQGMTQQAKSALLKITEEPPDHAYVVVLTTNINNLPATLISRCCVYNIENYTGQELEVYLSSVCREQDDKTRELLRVCNTPGQIKQVLTQGFQPYDFAVKVVEHICEVTGANALRITQQFKTKTDGEGYDAMLVLSLIQSIALLRGILTPENQQQEKAKLFTMVRVAEQYLNCLRSGVFSVKYVIDLWIIETRRRCEEVCSNYKSKDSN